MSKDITITQEEYAMLREDSLFLEALVEAGVNNWEGYEEALRVYNKMEDED